MQVQEKPRFAIVIGLIGRIGSGKSTFSQYICERNIRCVEGDEIPVEELLEQIIQLRKEGATLQEQKEKIQQSIEEIQVKLKSTYQERCKKTLDEWVIPTIVNRIYTLDEIQFMSKRNYFHKIFLDCPLLMRYENFKKKYSKYESSIDLSLFCFLDDSINYGLKLQDLIQQVKVTILNDGTLEQLDQKINENSSKIFREYKPNWDMYFMKLSVEVKKRSNCSKRSVGAILVSKDNRILSTGYNGTPYFLKDCYNDGCKRCNSNIGQGKLLMECRCIHAEDNCILDIGVRTCKEMGGTLYTTLFPCKWCAKVIVQAGITRLVYMEDFDGNQSMEIMDEFKKQNPGKTFIVKKQTLDNYVY